MKKLWVYFFISAITLSYLNATEKPKQFSEAAFDKKIMELVEDFEQQNVISTPYLKKQKFEIVKDISILHFVEQSENIPIETIQHIHQFIEVTEPITLEILKSTTQQELDMYVMSYFYKRTNYLETIPFPLPSLEKQDIVEVNSNKNIPIQQKKKILK